MSKPENPAAFPGKRIRYEESQLSNVPNSIEENYEGMTLRDYFAGQALSAAIRMGFPIEDRYSLCAEKAYKFADAMLAERTKAV